MTKLSTLFFKNRRTEEDTKARKLNNEFADVLNALDTEKREAPQESVNFILSFSKAYRSIPLKECPNGEMLIN
jgi:hypothetical protein